MPSVHGRDREARMDTERIHKPKRQAEYTDRTPKGEGRMSDHDTVLDLMKGLWHGRKVTRRRLIGYGAATAGALGATMLVPASWLSAFAEAKPYKIGSLQPLSGV